MDHEANGVSAVYCLKSFGRVIVAATAFVLAIMPGAQAAESQADRTVLPMPNTARPDLVVYDAKDPDAVFPAIPQVRPPEGSPNVLVVLLDDVGFGASSTFGGPCQTPTLERLAAGGLKYSRFHTTALCSPTRQALLTGRNHHSAGMAAITE